MLVGVENWAIILTNVSILQPNIHRKMHFKQAKTYSIYWLKFSFRRCVRFVVIHAEKHIHTRDTPYLFNEENAGKFSTVNIERNSVHVPEINSIPINCSIFHGNHIWHSRISPYLITINIWIWTMWAIVPN